MISQELEGASESRNFNSDRLIARVALESPTRRLYDYLAMPGLQPGMLVEVSFGRRQITALVVDLRTDSEIDPDKLKPILKTCDVLPPLPPDWIALCEFAAAYYLRGVGEVALPAVPVSLRNPARWEQLARQQMVSAWRMDAEAIAAARAALPKRARKAHELLDAFEASRERGAWLDENEVRRIWRQGLEALRNWVEQGAAKEMRQRTPQLDVCESGDATAATGTDDAGNDEILPRHAPALTPEQGEAVAAATAAIEGGGFAPFLLFGVTGSGKTEVYLRIIAHLLRQPEAQVLMLVPEINLTPRLEAAVRARFPGVPVATLHSGMAEGERARNWLAALHGEARIVLGTRLAILAPLPGLRAILVDEEHDPSYKQQEGLRYSARDLAVWRAKQRSIPVILGSATPSLESWQRAEQGAYRRLRMHTRAQHAARLPEILLLDLARESQQRRPLIDGFSQPLLAAIGKCLERGEQALLYLNRRGYAPVLACDACGWLSGCPRCSAWLVMHRAAGNAGSTAAPRAGLLCCHHCGFETRPPRQCPDCGNQDLSPLGRGTQRVEETLAARFPSARIARIDADSTRRKGSAEKLFDDVHAGEVDILVGTQMVAKGHDFQRITLVGILNPDSALFSHDFRAAERLFAQLMQVAGRAGRAGLAGEVLVQTRFPAAPVYQALLRHDYEWHARQLLSERRGAGLPPYAHQALLTAEAGKIEAALDFLRRARSAASSLPECADGRVVLHDPVPRAMVRVARRERGQLLVESPSRSALQGFLDGWLDLLDGLRPRVSWQLERDPVSI